MGVLHSRLVQLRLAAIIEADGSPITLLPAAVDNKEAALRGLFRYSSSNRSRMRAVAPDTRIFRKHRARSAPPSLFAQRVPTAGLCRLSYIRPSVLRVHCGSR